MLFSWLKSRRRQAVLGEPFPVPWYGVLMRNVRHFARMDSRQRTTVSSVAQVMVAEKNWVGGRELVVTDEMKVTIAGQAAVLLLGFDEPYYFDSLESIIVYDSPYQWPDDWASRRADGRPLAMGGEAHGRSPLVLNWRDVLASGQNRAAGENLVLHEFAHHLHFISGFTESFPPINDRQRNAHWQRIAEGEYLRLVGQTQRHEPTLLDQYGASNRMEFFAVATECFFERPRAMKTELPELYVGFTWLYHQDPAGWMVDASVPASGRAERAADEAAEAAAFRRHRLKVLRGHDPVALFTLATEYAYERRHRLAARLAARLIARDPRDYDAHLQRAAALIKLGRAAEAWYHSRAARKLEPNDMGWRLVRGAALLALGKPDEALDDLDEVVLSHRSDAEAHYLRGQAWAALGQFARALDDFAEALALQPLVAEVYYHTGLAQRALGQLGDAEDSLIRAFQLNPLVDRME